MHNRLENRDIVFSHIKHVFLTVCNIVVPGNLNYLYMEGDNGNPGATADVQSPIIQPQGPLCLQFWYFMKGTGVGELDVLLLVSLLLLLLLLHRPDITVPVDWA